MVIFHTSDIHDRLTYSKAQMLRKMKESEPDSLLLDSGDAILSGNVFFRLRGERVLKLMNRAGFDAMAMGNREFHFLPFGLKKKIGEAEFPVLCANIRARKGALSGVQPSVTLHSSGLRIAVFGLTVPMITESMPVERFSGFVFDDPIQAAAALVPNLKRDADKVIALTHIGLETDRRLAAAVPGIDIIIGGHTHTKLSSPLVVGETSIIHSGCHARHVSRVEVDSDGNVRSGLMELTEIGNDS